MTPPEKAVSAVNLRIERLQARLREADTETSRRFLVESIVATIGVGEALTDYIKTVGTHAKRLHRERKDANATLEAQHADLLKSGQKLLEQLKAKPTDKAIRKEIEHTQQSMAAIQKSLRRGTNALQRDVAPSIATIDHAADGVRRLSEADEPDVLKRVLKTLVQHVRELYLAQRTLPLNDTIDATAWEKSAGSEIEKAADFHDAYARAGYQAILALEVMTMAVSETPPQTLKEATTRGNAAVAARIKQIAARFT